MTAGRRILLTAAAVLLLPGCTSFADTVTAQDAVPSQESQPEPVGAAACPAERAEPDPDRPVIALDYRLEDDRTTVTGTETVAFTPDLPVRELVFRLVPNGPDSAPAGNRLVVLYLSIFTLKTSFVETRNLRFVYICLQTLTYRNQLTTNLSYFMFQSLIS